MGVPMVCPCWSPGYTPTPPSSVTSTGPALVCQTLLSSPCLSQGIYSFECSGNSYSCSKTP